MPRRESSDEIPLSVMLVGTATNVGGMERVICGLARNLPSHGLRVRTVFPVASGSDTLIAWCRDQGVEAAARDDVLDASAPHSLTRARAFRTMIQRSGVDIVNLHYGDNFLSLWDVLAARSSGLRTKVVVSIHHPTPWAETSARKRLMTAVGALMVHGVTTFSRATLQILSSTPIPRRRLHRIPCGISVPQNSPTRGEARRALGISDDLFVIGSLARLVEHKGIDTLISAMDAEDLEGSLLVVGGDGPLRQALQRQAEMCEHVNARFLGRLKEVDSLLAASDVFALPSRLEGFGLVYVEAAMHGVPSIGTFVGGIPDAVVDGVTGLLVEVDDLDELRGALRRLHSDPELRARLGVAARRRARTELDEQTMAHRFAELFTRIRAKRSRWSRTRRLLGSRAE